MALSTALGNQSFLSSRETMKMLVFDEKRYGRLKSAVYHGNRELIEALLKAGAPVNNSFGFHDMRSILHSAVYFGDPSIVKQLLDRGADVNVFDCNDESPLVLAAKMERNEITDLLLNAEGLQNCSNNENLTHLHIACMRNQVKIVKRLTQFESDIDAAVHRSSHNWPGFTALHFAVHFRSNETLEYLLSIGADITIGDARNLTPLHLANMKRDEQIMDMILLAHKSFPVNPEDSSGLSHFHIACTRNNTEIVKHFIQIRDDSDEPIHSTLVKPKPNWTCSYAIDLAIYFECVDVVELLLQCGDSAKSSYHDNDRIGAAYRTGNMAIVDLLMRKEGRGDDSMKIEIIPELHMACLNHERQTIKQILLKTPSSLNSSTWNGNLPLHTAIECGFEDVAEVLLLRGADYNKKNSQGKSALHLAFERDMRKIGNMMLSDLQLINQNPSNNDGLSHLHIACARGHVKAVKRLIELGEDVNAAVALHSHSWPGFTPLHFAVEFHSADVFQLLLANRASYSMNDARNLSPFDIALKQTRGLEYETSRAFQTMISILDAHYTSGLDSFNDRGFCCLHLIPATKQVGVDRAKKHIEKYPSDVNKSVHKFNSLFDGWTPLHFAIKYDKVDLAKLFLAKGANILSKSGNGDTPLSLILSRRQSDAYLEILHDFVHMQQSPVEVEGFPFFQLVCIAGSIDIIKYYLDKEAADPNCKNMNNDMPLHLIVAGCYSPAVDVAKLLIDYGANPNGRGSRMNTPLHSLTNESQSDIIDVLVSHGADINAKNAYSETPLLKLCEYAWDLNPEKRVKIVTSLLNNGADINLRDELGTSPLTTSTWEPEDGEETEICRDLIQILLKHVYKLQVIGSRINRSDLEACPTLMSRLPDELRFDKVKFLLECEKEFEAMKETRVDRYTTLHSILSKSLNELAVTEKNDALQQIVDSDDFRKKYPIYGPMLESQLRKGAVRRPLLEKSKKALSLLGVVSNSILPDVCTERIFQYLDNYDLKNIILSSGNIRM